jgi:glutamate N-acetyltransferase/amino-acid N-acetyltransferase
MKQVSGGVTAAKGFKATGIAAGLKASGKRDLALVVSEVPAVAAGTFTKNKFAAAPIIVSKKNIKGKSIRAIISNAGNANCANGKRGIDDAWTMVSAIAKKLGISKHEVLVTSTGIIGEPLPIGKIVSKIDALTYELKRDGSSLAAQAIMTTDTRSKEVAVEVKIGKKSVTIGGIAKGSGMIHPDMATMHALLTTDAKIDKATLQKVLTEAVTDTFNQVTVDRETSTNDCVFILANGASGVKITGADVKKFFYGVELVCRMLARKIAADGEGATKLLEVNVHNAKTKKDAQIAAKAVAGSDLIKAAMYGGDPNFGRILATLGACGVNFDPSKVDVYITGVQMVKGGIGINENKKLAAPNLKDDEIVINIEMNQGKENGAAWGCDLTEKYVEINADYHT